VTRLRLLAFTVVAATAAGLALPRLLAPMLRFSGDELLLASWSFGAIGPACAIACGALLARRLDRRRVLELPARLAATLLFVEALGLAAATVALVLHRAALPVVLGNALCAGALLAFVPVPVYAFARATLWPVAIGYTDDRVPDGRSAPLALQLGYCVAAVAAAALVPAAVFGATQLDAGAAADAAARAEATASRLATAAEPLDVAQATALVAHAPLAGGSRAVLRAPSGTLLPEEAAAEITGRAYVEAPSLGALRGGAVRVTYVPRPASRALLLAVTVGLLLCAIAVAAALGQAVRRDVERVTAQVEQVAARIAGEGSDSGRRVGRVGTTEVAAVAHTTNRLLDRIPRFTIESFLAIEHSTEAQKLKSQFLANMSHDLRSPLNSILGFSELLLRGVEGPIKPGQEVALAAINARGLHILRLLNEILDTAKIESGKLELHRQRTAPAEILRLAVQEARRGRPAKVADRVSIVLQPGLQPIYCDPLRLTQTAMHLLNYGLDLSQAGEVTLRAHASESRFVLELEFDAALPAAAELFDSFRRGAGSAGLNLSLPLARRLILAHGGTFEVVTRDPARLRAALPDVGTGRARRQTGAGL
jgi:signal transduction histidine kinase